MKLKNKVKANVPRFILDIIEKDSDHFNISKEKLCNEILVKFSLKFRSNYCAEMLFEETDSLQFSLNKDNQKYYNELLAGIKDTTESEILRETFSAYAILPAFMRETYLYREKVVFLKSSLKEYRVLNIHTVEDGIVEGKIDSIFRNKKNDYLMIVLHGKNYYLSQSRILN